MESLWGLLRQSFCLLDKRDSFYDRDVNHLPLVFLLSVDDKNLYCLSQRSINPAPHLFLQTHFCWKTAVPICSHIVWGYFCTPTTELSSCNRGHMDPKTKIFIIWPFEKKFTSPWSEPRLVESSVI